MKHLSIITNSTLKSKARYVKVEVSAMDLIPEGNDGAGHVPWTFIDEIELF